MRLVEGVSLFDHQMKAVKFCTSRDAALICFTTGSGKSLINIATAIWHTNDNIDKFIVVVTASSIIELENDFAKFTGDIPPRVKRTEDLIRFLDSKDPIALVQYNWLKDFVEYKEVETRFGNRVYCNIKGEVHAAMAGKRIGISFDEAHMLKTPKSMLAKAAKAFRKEVVACYGFTATPVTRELMDIYYVSEILSPGWFGSYNRFCANYILSYKMGNIKKIYGYKNLDKLNKELSGLMLTYFPEKKINFVKHACDLTRRDDYEEAARGLFEVDVPDELEDVGDADEAVSSEEAKTFSARLVDLQYIVDEDPAKLEKFVSLVKENLSTGMIVFCAYHRSIGVIKDVLKKENIQHREITGKNTTKARKAAKDWFNDDPKNKVLILSKAGGQSLNLQSCPTFIFYETPQNPASLLQALGRIVRIGSAYDEFFIHFVIVDDTVDQYKYDYVSQNKEVFEKVMNNKTLPTSNALSGYNSFIIDKLKRKYLWNRHEKNIFRDRH